MWLLIIVLSTSSGMSTSSTEFSNKESCDKAQAELTERFVGRMSSSFALCTKRNVNTTY